jgi:hypothetical protein
VRLTTFPVLADGFHRRHGPRAPSRGPLSFRRRIGRRAPTRLLLEHLLVTDSVHGSLESAPARRTSRRHDRRFASREGHERCDRIEMLSVAHHSFARVRITPRHARVEPGRPSSCYGGGWLYRVLGAFDTIRSGPYSGPGRLPCWGRRLAAHAGGRRSTPTFRWVASSSGSAVGSFGGLAALVGIRHAPQRRGRLLRPNTFAGRCSLPELLDSTRNGFSSFLISQFHFA